MTNLDVSTNEYRRRMGQRLRTIREKLGETQTQFAQRLGVIKLSVLKYEAGTTCPTAEQLHNLEQTGVDASYAAFGYPSLASEQSRQNFSAALTCVKRECQIASLDVSDEHLVEAAWFLFCKLNEATNSTIRTASDDTSAALKFIEGIQRENG